MQNQLQKHQSSTINEATAESNRHTFVEEKYRWVLLIDLPTLVVGYQSREDRFWIQWKETP